MIFLNGKPKTNIRWTQKFSEFRVLVVRRKLSSIASLNLEHMEDYDFDSDFETNSENAECFVDESGVIGTGLFSRGNPPTWQDFIDNATTCQVVEDPIRSAVSGDYLFCSGNQSQNAGQTNYYFDCQVEAVANLPQFDYTRIRAQNDGYVWAYDVWLTPFKPYTFAYFQDGGHTYFKWYGNGQLIQPSWVDGGCLPGDEPILSGDDTKCRFVDSDVDYYAGVVPETTYWDYPNTSNIKFVPTVMDNKISLNINWFLITNNTNTNLGGNLACSNTYRDDTTISGGTTEDDILYEGILKKYYGQNEEVEGESEEPHFVEDKCVCVYREFDIHDMLRHYGNNNNPSSVSNSTLIGNFFRYMDYSWLNHSYVSTPKFLKEYKNNRFEEHTATVSDYIDSSGRINETAFDEVPLKIPKTIYNIPTPNSLPTPTSKWENTFEFYNTNPYQFDHYELANFMQGWEGNPNEYGQVINTYPPSASGNPNYDDSDLNKAFIDEYCTTWLGESKQNEWIDEMIKLSIPKDDKVRCYTFYADKINGNSSSTIVTYFNKYMDINSVNNVGIYTASPIVVAIIGNGFSTTGETSYSKSMGGCIKSNGTDTENYCYPSNMENSPLITDTTTSTTKNAFFGTPDSDIALYIAKCEQSWYAHGEGATHYANTIGVYTPIITYKIPNGNLDFNQLSSFMTLLPDHYTGSNKQISDPLQKSSNGNIPIDNPDTNAGAGCDDKDPASLGTNRTHVEPVKEIPPISTNILASGLLSMYVIDNSNLNKLGGDLFSNNIFTQIQYGVQKPIDCILRIAESRVSPIVETSDRAVQLGSTSLTARGYRATKCYRTIECGEVLIKRINGDYTDNDEKIMIYLPYIGFKQLDGNILQNTKIKLKYTFNFLNGTCMATIYWTPVAGNPVYENAKGNWSYLTSFTGEFISTFPIGSSSNTGMLSMLMSAGLGVMSHNSYYARASIRSAPNAFSPTFEHNGEFGSNCSNMINILQPYVYKFSLRHTFPHNSAGDPSVENTSGKINGLFTGRYITIYDDILKPNPQKNGFIQCDNFELKATPTSITAEECEMLKNLFNEGVWVE